LYGKTVSITAGHLDYGLQTLLGHIDAGRNTTQPNNACLIVSDICGINDTFQEIDFPVNESRIHMFWRAEFSSHSKVASSEHAFKIAS
jgi:hypothetical protein